jgi:hypothetical protein
MSSLLSTNTDTPVAAVVETIKTFEKLGSLGYYNDEKKVNISDGSDEENFPLIQDIDQLTDILGGIIKRENTEVYEVCILFMKN